VAGGLRSAAVARLPRYYAPLRLPTGPPAALCIPRRPAGSDPQSVGSLRFLTVLSVRAAPLYPGEPSDYQPMEITG